LSSRGLIETDTADLTFHFTNVTGDAAPGGVAEAGTNPSAPAASAPWGA